MRLMNGGGYVTAKVGIGYNVIVRLPVLKKTGKIVLFDVVVVVFACNVPWTNIGYGVGDMVASVPATMIRNGGGFTL